MRLLVGHHPRRNRARRAGDGAVRQLVWRALGSPDGGVMSPHRLGLLLLAMTAVTMLAAAPVLATAEHDWLTLSVVAAVLVLACALAAPTPDRWWAGYSGLAFPALAMAGLCTASTEVPGLAAPLVGLLTLCFAHIGLTMRPGSALLALPAAGATFIWANGTWDRAIAIRLVVGLVIWLLLAELLAALTGRQRTLTADLRAAAHTDVLTGVANRRDLEMRLAATQPGDTVIVTDLDHFKVVNDTLGHAVGDQVLADFGASLRLTLRAGDYCARLGGEEFVIILSGASVRNAGSVTTRLRTTWATVRPEITFSTGIAICRADRPPAATLAAADAALYGAKRDGRNRDQLEVCAAEVVTEPVAADPPSVPAV